MIGSLNRVSREVTIVGGGISGLLAAYYLDRAGWRVKLVERDARLGGLLATTQTQWGIAESAAHSILAGDIQRALFDELGVRAREVNPGARARYVVRDGRLSRFPLRPWEAVTTLTRAQLVPSRAQESQEGSVAEWARRHLGQAALDYLVDPMVAGIFAARPDELSLAAAFPQMAVPAFHTLASHGLAHRILGRPRSSPPERARKSICAPEGGMGALVSALESRLRSRLSDDAIRVGVELTSLPDAPNTVLCVPADAAGRLLREEDPRLASSLMQVEYVPLVCVTAFLSRAGFEAPPTGIGFLCPSREKRSCLGILFNSSSFPGRVADESRWVSVTALFGGTRDPSALSGASDQELGSRLLREARELLGYRSGEAHLIVRRWPRAIPKYDERVRRVWQAAREGWCAEPGRILFGNFAGQVSLRGMIESACRLAASLQP